MMKSSLRLIVAALVLFLTFDLLSQSKRQIPFKNNLSLKEMRIALRLGGRPLSSTPLQTSSVSPVSDWAHYPIKIEGGSAEFKSQINKMLSELKEKEPLFYNVAKHRVDSITWAPKSGSYAAPNHQGKGKVWIGGREWNHSLRRAVTFTALIHEIQHCNTFGDSNEGAARYAGFYYGKKLNLHPFIYKWSKHVSTKVGYKPEWWQDNLTNTRLNYKAQPKNDFNTAKYAKDHTGLFKKQGLR